MRTVWITSQAIKFPAFSIDKLDYRRLAFEYATTGTTSVSNLEEQVETLNCSGEERQNAYYKVHYRGPQVVFRITDTRHNRVILIEERNLGGSTTYGRGSCRPDKAPLTAFNPQGQWLNRLHQQLLQDAQQELMDFIADHGVLRYEELRFPLFYVQSNANRFHRINQAADRAAVAFELYQQYGVTLEAEDMLRALTKTWEVELASLQDDASLRAISVALHRNLVAAYFYLGQFDAARRHDALAQALGQPQEESWQERIRAHERHFILSPVVASDPLRVANLYRLGQNVVAEAQLAEADYGSLQEDLRNGNSVY